MDGDPFVSIADQDAMFAVAAVVGREFSRAAVDALSPPGEVAAVGSTLMALMRRRLVRPDRSAPPREITRLLRLTRNVCGSPREHHP